MKKYEKVRREDYEAWYRDNRDYRERVRADESRLAYHLMPETGWLNDPNGLCQFQGLYHIYYQYTPFEPTGEIKLWGHYTTRDFIYYKQEEPALFPDQDLDAHGVYSGSAYVEDKTIHYFYTGNVKLFDRDDYDYIMSGRVSNTIHVTSRDGYHFSAKELVMNHTDYPADMSCHIRDPKVFKKGEYYYMVLGARDTLSKGMVLVYRSMDLTNWEYFNRITTEQTFGYMWECPDLFCLDGQLCLVCCPQGVKPMGTEYQNVHQCTVFCLDYDFRENTIRLNSQFPGMVDRGFDFYAPQTFLDEQGRHILIGWMGIPDAEYTNPTVKAGWQHALTMPRLLHMREGRLLQQPLEEMKELRRDRRDYDFWELGKGVETGLVFEACLSMESCSDMCLTIRDDVTLSYEDGLLTLDMGTSGSGRTRRSVLLEQLTDLRIFSDTTSLEIFANDGLEVFTTRVYGDRPGMRIKGKCCGTVSVYELSGFIYE